MAIAAAGALALVIPPIAVLAQTGTPPPDGTGTVDAGPPWSLILVAGSIALVVAAMRFRALRRWIAAAVVLVGAAIAALAIVYVGTVGGWSGRPTEPWTVPGAIAALLIGLVLAIVVIRRWGSRRLPS